MDCREQSDIASEHDPKKAFPFVLLTPQPSHEFAMTALVLIAKL
jgi:hypothetical protein